jgi:hypothetical protein
MNPKKYELLVTHGGNDADQMRHIEDQSLSNTELMAKIHKQLMQGRSARDFAIRNRPAWQVTLTWDKLLKTKLFNNQH